MSNTITLYETPQNNHGCRGYGLELKIVSEREAEVKDGISCNSAWLVGHNDSDPLIAVGTRVALPEEFRGTWEQAAVPTGHSHNELVDDADDPQPDSTTVGPYDLIRIEN